ncbi:MAG: SGNH/GDSL hydrolase family protein, partial [Chloroflexus sp.]
MRRIEIIDLTLAGAICLGGFVARPLSRHDERLFHLIMTTFDGEPATTAQIVLFGDLRAAVWPVPAEFAIANCG